MIPSLTDFPSLRRPMTQEESEIFLRAMMAEESDLGGAIDLSNPMRSFPGLGELPFAMAVFCKRLEVYSPGTEVTPAAVMFMLCLCKNPAMAVMWAYTVHRVFQSRGRFTMGVFADQFPFGIPTEEGYREAWRAQKRVDETPGGMPRSDNLLDSSDGWAGEASPEPQPARQDETAEPEQGQAARKFDLSS